MQNTCEVTGATLAQALYSAIQLCRDGFKYELRYARTFHALVIHICAARTPGRNVTMLH